MKKMLILLFIALSQISLTTLAKLQNAISLKDDKGNTLLHYAYLAGDPNLIQTLVDEGADVNAKNNEGLAPRENLMNEFNKAMFYSPGTEEFKRLGKAWANTEHPTTKQSDEGFSLAHYAVALNHPDLVKAIVNYGTGTTATNAEGITPSEHNGRQFAKAMVRVTEDTEPLNKRNAIAAILLNAEKPAPEHEEL